MEGSLEDCLVLGEPKGSSKGTFLSRADVVGDHIPPLTTRQPNLQQETTLGSKTSSQRTFRTGFRESLGTCPQLVLLPLVAASCHTLVGFQDLPAWSSRLEAKSAFDTSTWSHQGQLTDSFGVKVHKKAVREKIGWAEQCFLGTNTQKASP